MSWTTAPWNTFQTQSTKVQGATQCNRLTDSYPWTIPIVATRSGCTRRASTTTPVSVSASCTISGPEAVGAYSVVGTQLSLAGTVQSVLDAKKSSLFTSVGSAYVAYEIGSVLQLLGGLLWD